MLFQRALSLQIYQYWLFFFFKFQNFHKKVFNSFDESDCRSNSGELFYFWQKQMFTRIKIWQVRVQFVITTENFDWFLLGISLERHSCTLKMPSRKLSLIQYLKKSCFTGYFGLLCIVKCTVKSTRMTNI